MSRCQGRPNEECPARARNDTVKLCQGDLMLCRDCENFRFPNAASKPVTVTDAHKNIKPDTAMSMTMGHPKKSYSQTSFAYSG